MRLGKFTALIGALALTACSGAGNSTGSGSSAASTKSVQQVDINQIQQAVTNAQTAVTNAQTALGTFFNLSTGSFNWTVLLGNVNFSNMGTTTETCLQNAFPAQDPLTLALTVNTDIATAIQCVTTDAIQVLGIANTDLTSAMSILNSALATAAPGSAEYTEIQSMITEVQSAQTEYNSAMTMLANELNIVLAALNNTSTLVEGLIPTPVLNILAGMAVQTFIQPIETVIQSFQTQLKAL